METKIRNECLALFNEWKQKKTDVFDIQEEFEREYPGYKDKNIIENTELVLDIDVNITGSATIMDAK
jgi:hypothetical protein